MLPQIRPATQPKGNNFAPLFYNLPEINVRQRYSHNKKIPVSGH
jgi:hypothetical protein